jgi:putative chitinase
MLVTKDKLLEIFPNAINTTMNLDEIVEGLNASPLLTTLNRMAGFVAQAAHESAQFKVVKENLNYSAEGLRRVFPKYFPTDDVAASYARQATKIANKVYANRMGNGDEASGDGFKYRGRGFFQITGKFNYTSCGTGLGLDLVKTPEALERTKPALASALWFWKTNNLNRYADANDIRGMTKAINGGYNGLDERTYNYLRAKKVLSI